MAVKVTPSIVAVEVGDGDFGRNFVPFVAGSGVVIGDGLIVTNHHVIQEGNSVQVVLQDGSIHRATVLGSDADTDLAVLHVDADGLVAVDVGTRTTSPSARPQSPSATRWGSPEAPRSP